MSTREIAVLIEKQHSHLKISAERLADKGVIGTLAVREFTHNGNTYTEYLLNKRDSLILVAQNCPEFTARIVDRWQELEAQQAQPTVQLSKAEQSLRIAGMVSEMLNLEGSAKLGTMRRALELHGPEFVGILPVYSVDAPNKQTSSMVTFSATHLLKKHSLDISTKSFNLILAAKGILERKYRKSKDGESLFWCISKSGLKYGKNVTNEKNPLETQPHWYEETFQELLKELNIK